MPDYQDSKIYKIVNYDNDDVYIGSTIEPTLARRLAKHVRGYKCYLNGKGNYVTSYKIIKTGNYDIQLIELYPCNSKMELHAREGYWIKRMDCVNKVVPGRTMKEYYEDNKELYSEKAKKYYEKHKDSIDEYQKSYRNNNKDIISEYQKKYRKRNKGSIAEYHKEYQKNNKEAISEKRNKKEQCICGSRYTLRNKAQHMKCKTHQSYVNSIEFYQDVYEMVKSVVNKFPKSI